MEKRSLKGYYRTEVKIPGYRYKKGQKGNVEDWEIWKESTYTLKLPNQHYYSGSKGSKNDWLDHHGCSLIVEDIALQYLGVSGWNISKLYDWHKKNQGIPYSKVTLGAVSKALKRIAGNNGYIKFHSGIPSYSAIESALFDGSLVLFERGNPIHSVCLFTGADNDIADNKAFLLNNGSISKVDIKEYVKKRTANEKYRGFIAVDRYL